MDNKNNVLKNKLEMLRKIMELQSNIITSKNAK